VRRPMRRKICQRKPHDIATQSSLRHATLGYRIKVSMSDAVVALPLLPSMRFSEADNNPCRRNHARSTGAGRRGNVGSSNVVHIEFLGRVETLVNSVFDMVLATHA
jgi:hypothetical protein